MPPRSPEDTVPTEAIQQHDRERFLASMFVPADRRPAVWALLAFNLEIARVREVVSQPVIGQIRLQWWRDALEEIYTGKPPRRHEIVGPLAAAIERHRLTRTHFDTMIDGREFDLEDAPPDSLAALECYLERTSSRLLDLELEVLGIEAPAAFDAARHVGIAWGLVGIARAVPFHAAQGRVLLPADLLAGAGVSPDALLTGKASVAAAVRPLVESASAHLDRVRALRRDVPAAARPALLLARVAGLHLRRLASAGCDPFDARLTAPDPWAVPRLFIARYFNLS